MEIFECTECGVKYQDATGRTRGCPSCGCIYVTWLTFKEREKKEGGK